MPAFDECCVLIPAATLEDFPTHLPTDQARSLLAGWTVLWHPALLAHSQQLPVWYRADAPPEPAGPRLLAIPSPSLDMLPAGFQARAAETGGWVLTGADRHEMLQQLQEQLAAEQAAGSGSTETDSPLHRFSDTTLWQPLRGSNRVIEVDDFFAAGYTMLQIQVMTRRLRYTSNLDEVHLQTRLIAAAEAFIARQADAAIDALHDVFDALAEERDHYFSSDPHLIDLTLTTPSTVDSLLEEVERWRSESDSSGSSSDDNHSADNHSADNDSDDDAAAVSNDFNPSPLATVRNVLIDAAVAEAISRKDATETQTLRKWLSDGKLGWAGGGPASDPGLDAMNLSEAEAVFVTAFEQTRDAIGCPPPVYGRFAGATPTDLTRTLATLGYCGVIPLDFANGRGHGDEAKVILQTGGAELEALTAKPIDAADDSAFLSLGSKLGESIDSGEIATGLFAHWPGQSCPAMDDLRRVASWCLALGRFWKLEDYFRAGEHPYHHGSTENASSQSSELLDDRVAGRVPDPISALADHFVQAVTRQQQQLLSGMASLVTQQHVAADEATDQIARSVAGDPPTAETRSDRKGRLLINPHSVGSRHQTSIKLDVSATHKHIYGVSRSQKQTDVTVDVPGCGFVALSGGKAPATKGSFKDSLRGLFGRGPSAIVEGDHLRNEFMEVTFSDETGGISGVYSGERGNRFSMRLIRNRPAGGGETEMQCERIKTLQSSPAIGVIESRGEIADVTGGKALAQFVMRFTLQRGSRFLRVDVELTPNESVHGDPWHEYYGARVAVASEASVCRALVRDKVHRVKTRRVVAPLGVVIDEAERQTLVAANGLAFHRRVGERFVDTLLRVQSETRSNFTLYYGFDVNNPVAASRMLLAPAREVDIDTSTIKSAIGWFVHVAPKEVLIDSLHIDRRTDGTLAAIVRLIQTRPKSCKTTVRFLHNVNFARTLEGNAIENLNLPRPDKNDKETLDCKGDAITVNLGSHGVKDVLVVFK